MRLMPLKVYQAPDDILAAAAAAAHIYVNGRISKAQVALARAPYTHTHTHTGQILNVLYTHKLHWTTPLRDKFYGTT